MRDDFKKKSYISEDEGAGYAAPIVDLISSSAIMVLPRSCQELESHRAKINLSSEQFLEEQLTRSRFQITLSLEIQPK